MAKDKIHEQVKNALIKDGWTITHDPYALRYKEIKMSADLGAERTLAAEQDGQKIAVEIKSFVGLSQVQDMKVALGQYNMYIVYLNKTDPERNLYLAVDHQIYPEFFQQEAIQLLLEWYRINMIVVDIDQEEILQWLNW